MGKAYQFSVSNLGRVRTPRAHISYGSGKPYKKVFMLNRRYSVHRLVCQAFHGPAPTSKHSVNHIDLDITNNTIENLEWASPGEQSKHSHTLRPEQRKKTGATLSKAVIATCVKTGKVRRFPSLKGAGIALGIRGICTVFSTISKQRSGYKFEYEATPELEGEVWKCCVDENTIGSKHAFISNFGRIRNKIGVVSKGSLMRKGYRRVSISHKNYYVHRLVAKYFLGPGPSSLHTTVNHKDFDRDNNHVCNLEWATRSDQVVHSYSRKDRKFSGKAQGKPIQMRKIGTKNWQKFESQSNAARVLGIHQAGISLCCRGGQSQVSGYECRFVSRKTVEILPGEIWRDYEFKDDKVVCLGERR